LRGEPMNILFATPVQPFANKPRPHHLIKSLAARGHSVHLLAQASSWREVDGVTEDPRWRPVQDACSSIDWVVIPKIRSLAQCAVSVPTPTPLRVAYCRSPEYRRKAEALIERHGCELAHVHRDRLAPAFRELDTPKVLDANDCMTLYLRQTMRYGSPRYRVLSAFELTKIRAHEARMAAGYSACLVTGEADARALRAIGCPEPIDVVPNGVDERFFRCEPEEAEDTVVFVGTMHYPPNVDAALWFTKHIWPRVKAARPGARLRLVGHRPSAAVRRLSRLPGVEVTGSVPDVMPHLASATVFVAPLRIGGGFPNKVAEALAAGVPAVATPAGNGGVRGLVPGDHLLVAETAEEFVRRTLALLEDAGLRGRLRESGRRFMWANYRWDNIGAQLERIHGAAIGRARSKRRDEPLKMGETT
jgi:polysaccharide biosynthesis protein PslH